MSPPPFSKLAAQAPKTPRAGTRLTARSGIKEEPEEDLSDSDEDLFTGRKKPKKESLKDLLDSEPCVLFHFTVCDLHVLIII